MIVSVFSLFKVASRHAETMSISVPIRSQETLYNSLAIRGSEPYEIHKLGKSRAWPLHWITGNHVGSQLDYLTCMMKLQTWSTVGAERFGFSAKLTYGKRRCQVAQSDEYITRKMHHILWRTICIRIV